MLLAAACTSMSPPSVDDGASTRKSLSPGRRIEGRGFAVLVPAGEGWTLVQRTSEAIVFGKYHPAAQSRSGVGPYAVLAGVQTVSPEDGEDFTGAARRWLTRSLMVPGRQLVSLDLHIVPWQGTVCVQYDALQVDRYDFDQSTTRFEFPQSGRLCRHPSETTLWILAFRNRRSVRFDGPPPGWRQGQDFVDRVLFV